MTPNDQRISHRPHTMGRHWGTLPFLLLAATWLAACGTDPVTPGPGTDNGDTTPPQPLPGEYGADCRTESDCTDTRCIALSNAADASFCTVRCATDDDCPADGVSSCLSITNADGLIQICLPSDLCIDRDSDGFGEGPGCRGKDCNDQDPGVYPGAPEYCDGKDNNCNGFADDNTVDTNRPCDTGNLGVCAEGLTVCEQSAIVCLASVIPGTRQELCDGLDNDCDGLVDEGAGDPDESNGNYVLGIGNPCGTPGDACFRGYQYCDNATGALECDDDFAASAVPDLCDGIDNNCDGQIDEDANDPNGVLGQACSAGVSICRGTGTWVCDSSDAAAPPVCSAVENTGNAAAEICDYEDNNCDGDIDEPFKNAQNQYHTAQHCGTCENNCITKWGDANLLGILPVCNSTRATPVCEYTCAANRYNLDRASENGCEFEPDLDAIYVAQPAMNGSDTTTCGTFDAPCATIAHATTRATTSPRKARVRVSEGVFPEAVTLVNGVSVMGGHSSVNWLRNPSVNTTTLTGILREGPHVMNVKASGINQATVFSGFSINGGDAAVGGNSYAIYVSGTTNALRIEDNTIFAGRGGAGLPGTEGRNGSVGSNGGRGIDRSNLNATCSNSASPPVMAGGTGGPTTCAGQTVSGGQGAPVTLCPTASTGGSINGNANGQAFAGSGTAGGTGGRSPEHSSPSSVSAGNHLCQSNGSSVVKTPEPGQNGASGTNGSAGAAASSGPGAIVAAHWRGPTSGPGASGTNGSGGGGGGSSEGIRDTGGTGIPVTFHYGPTGGGGGAGGCAAAGGNGGLAGGGSFGIFVVGASGAPTIVNNAISRGQGGRGGQGGLGGVGGTGGAGGNGGTMTATVRWTRCGQFAAQGGTGGDGGHGGGGAGGNGGASIAIALAGAAAPGAYASGNQFPIPESTATAGPGGLGGGGIVSPGASGATGLTQNVRSF